MATADSSRGPAELALLFFLTSALLIGAELALSHNRSVTIDALRIYALMIVLAGAAGLIARAEQSLELSFVVLTAYLAAALWLGTAWAGVPLLLAAAVFFATTPISALLPGLRHADIWLGAIVAAGLILTAVHLADFLILEKAVQGAAHQDTLYHASIAGMLKTYGIASTGLNGLVLQPYHVLSHRVLAGFSVLTGVHVLEVYGIAGIVVLCPLLLYATVHCMSRLAAVGGPPRPARLWLATCAVLIALKLSPIVIWTWMDSYFISESYGLGLVYFLLAVPVIVSPAHTMAEHAVAAALLVAAGLTKGSVGLQGIALLGLRCLIFPPAWGRLRSIGIAAAAGVTLLILLAGAAASVSLVTAFRPFYAAQGYGIWTSEVRQTVEMGLAHHLPAPSTWLKAIVAVALFLVLNFLLSWIVVLRRIIGAGWRGAWRHPDALLTVALVAPCFVFLQYRFPGNWYPINLPMFFALPLLGAAMAGRIDRLRPRAVWAMSAVAVTAVAWLVVQGYRDQPQGAVFVKSEAYVALLKDRGRGGHIGALVALRDRRDDGRVVYEADPTFPKPLEGLWDCFHVPFTYPAITEKAWVGILETGRPCTYNNYGYRQYFPGGRGLVPPVIPPGARVVRVSAADGDRR